MMRIDEMTIDREQTGHALLLGWARWSTTKKRGNTCRSIEKRHTPELGSVWEGGKTWAVPMPPAKDALAVERAVVALPAAHRLMVRRVYLDGYEPAEMRREMALTEEGCVSLLGRARIMVCNSVGAR
jgi:DNA-directed RNA polymerase specialized sigma24 family protein